jgi:hypothetical protein
MVINALTIPDGFDGGVTFPTRDEGAAGLGSQAVPSAISVE